MFLSISKLDTSDDETHFWEKKSKLEQLKRAFEGPHLKHKGMPLSQTDPVGTFCLIDFADKGFILWRAHKQLLSI